MIPKINIDMDGNMEYSLDAILKTWEQAFLNKKKQKNNNILKYAYKYRIFIELIVSSVISYYIALAIITVIS